MDKILFSGEAGTTCDKKVKISVIIPTKNSQKRIETCLNSLVNQSYSNYEIIIVDGHSSDNTIKIVSKYPVRVFFEEGGTRASACNVGISNAIGEIVAFTDDDCIVPENWLEQIAMNFDNPKVQVLGGPSLTPQDSPRVEKAFGATFTQILAITAFGNKSGENIVGCNSAYRKSSILNVGGFNEKLVTGEEIELHYRICREGGSAFYDPSMVVYHNRRANFRLFFKQFYRYGVGKGCMLREHPKTLGVSDIVAFAPFVYLPVLLLIAVLDPFLAAMAFLFTFVFFTVTVLFLSVFFNFKAKGKVLFHLIFLALIIYVVAESVGHLVGVLKR